MRHNSIKKTLATIATAALTLLSVAPGFAATTATCTNGTTQSFSTNICTNTLVRRVQVENQNEADVENELVQTANTGMNIIGSVNGDVSYTTGDVNASSTTTTKVNLNDTKIDLGGGDVKLTGSNNTTQSGSTNIANNVYDTSIEIENENELDVENEVEALYSTGGNMITSVNGDVDGASGDVDAVSKMTTEGNQNKTEVKGMGGVEINSTNSKTQSGSLNVANSVFSGVLEIENENEADIENEYEVEAYTGGNMLFSVNGDVHNWDSGSIDIGSDIKNGPVNSNSTKVNHWADGIKVTSLNDTTQSLSVNMATATIILSAEIENENELDVENEVEIYADSGLNSLMDINGDVDSTTGDVDESSKIVNEGNDNFTDFDADGAIEALASNKTTQSLSLNDAVNTIVLSLEVENFNEAEVENEVELLGYTGGNFGMEVNGDVGMDTGDIDLCDEITTKANTNNTEVDEGFDDADTEATNDMTQSGSINSATNTVSHEVEAENENELDLENDSFEQGLTGGNMFVDVNGDFDLNSGAVDESAAVSSSGNSSTNSL